MNGYLARLLEFNGWANLALLDFLATLPPPVLDSRQRGVYGSIRETLAHMLESELKYQRYLAGLPRSESGAPARLDLPALRSMAERSATALTALTFPDAAALLPLPDGQRAAATVLTQLIAHGHEHRTQVQTILGAHGFEPPEISAWAHGILLHGDDRPEGWNP